MQVVVENFEDLAPMILHIDRPMTDEEFVEFCHQYEDYTVEVSAEGEITISPPPYSKTGRQNAQILLQLGRWAEDDGRGEVYNSEAGFVLPNGARRSPDASWIRNDRVAAQPFEYRDKFYRLCPDFVIELRSATDRLKRLHTKMVEYVANGAELGWLIDPQKQTVWIYRPGREPEQLEHPQRVEGEGPVAGFVLDLAKVWG